MTLADHLGACMREVNHFSNSAGAQKHFTASLQRDPELKTAAQKWLIAMDGVDDKRCVITKTYRNAIKEALANGG